MLTDWLADSYLAADMPLDELRITPGEFARIRSFRDTLWRVIPALVHGQPLQAEDLTLINEAAGPPPRPRLKPDGTRGWLAPVTGAQVLGAAARDVIEVIGTEKSKRVRQCEGVNCYLLFLDTSRPGNRRWCSMQRCGNRHKVTSYRSRQADRATCKTPPSSTS